MTKKAIFNQLTTWLKIIWNYEKNKNQSLCFETKVRNRRNASLSPLSPNPVIMFPFDSNIPASQWSPVQTGPRGHLHTETRKLLPSPAPCTTAGHALVPGLFYSLACPSQAGFPMKMPHWFFQCSHCLWHLVQHPAHMTLHVSSKIMRPSGIGELKSGCSYSISPGSLLIL